MRLAGKLDDQHDAATLIDYLLTQGINAKTERQGDAWDLWIYDEDQFARGREELAAFKAEPQAERFRNAGREAERIRREKAQREIEARRNLIQASPVRTPRVKRPLTMVLLAGMVVVFVFSDFGKDRKFLVPFYMDKFVYVDGDLKWTGLSPQATFQAEPWRLFAPIFIHANLPHILMNALALLSFGTLIETLRGTWRFAVLVLFLAALSNLTQYWLDHRQGFVSGFGGMSGVVFGMFGYIWMKAWNEPWSGFQMTNQTIVLMFIWHALCITGTISNVANGAHVGGQIAGMLAGAAPTLLGFSRTKR
jgi:GlpG protein